MIALSTNILIWYRLLGARGMALSLSFRRGLRRSYSLNIGVVFLKRLLASF